MSAKKFHILSIISAIASFFPVVAAPFLSHFPRTFLFDTIAFLSLTYFGALVSFPSLIISIGFFVLGWRANKKNPQKKQSTLQWINIFAIALSFISTLLYTGFVFLAGD